MSLPSTFVSISNKWLQLMNQTGFWMFLGACWCGGRMRKHWAFPQTPPSCLDLNKNLYVHTDHTCADRAYYIPASKRACLFHPTFPLASLFTPLWCLQQWRTYIHSTVISALHWLVVFLWPLDAVNAQVESCNQHGFAFGWLYCNLWLQKDVCQFVREWSMFSVSTFHILKFFLCKPRLQICTCYFRTCGGSGCHVLKVLLARSGKTSWLNHYEQDSRTAGGQVSRGSNSQPAMSRRKMWRRRQSGRIFQQWQSPTLHDHGSIKKAIICFQAQVVNTNMSSCMRARRPLGSFSSYCLVVHA